MMTPAEARAELRDSPILDHIKASILAIEDDLDGPHLNPRIFPEERDLAQEAHGRLIELKLELEGLCDGALGSRMANRKNAEAEADCADDTPTMEIAA